MHTQRTHVILPQDLLTEIDGLVGPRGRSAFLVETVRAELQRRKLLEFLRSDEPVWRDEDHPELAAGAEAWVRSLRAEGRGAKAVKAKPARKRTP
jgi:hypothetical protein